MLRNGLNGITWSSSKQLLNMGIWAANSTTDGDLNQSEWRDLYGLKYADNDGTFVPAILPAPLDPAYHDLVSESILGRLLEFKSFYKYSYNVFSKTSSPNTAQGYYLKEDGTWTTTDPGYRDIGTNQSLATNNGNFIIGKPYKIIESVNKSGLLFLRIEMNHIADDNPYYGWQFTSYLNSPELPTGYEYAGSFPHTLGAVPSLKVYLDACVGNNLDDGSGGSILNDSNYKEYSKYTYSPIDTVVTGFGGKTEDIVTHTTSGGSTNAQLWSFDPDGKDRVHPLTTIKLGMSRNVQTLLFFVNKGQQVWLVGNWSYSFGNNGGMRLFFGSRWVIGGSGPLRKADCLPRYKIEATIY